MRRYFYGDWIFDEDYSCEVVEIWEYNTQLDDKWELIEVYPLTKDYEDSEFNNAGNLTPDDEGYVFLEISEDNFNGLKEDYTIYNELLSLIGRELNFDDINCCFNTRDEEVIISKWHGAADSFSSFDVAYQCYYNIENSTIFIIYITGNTISNVCKYEN